MIVNKYFMSEGTFPTFRHIYYKITYPKGIKAVP
jgi:hypothetical protein